MLLTTSSRIKLQGLTEPLDESLYSGLLNEAGLMSSDRWVEAASSELTNWSGRAEAQLMLSLDHTLLSAFPENIHTFENKFIRRGLRRLLREAYQAPSAAHEDMYFLILSTYIEQYLKNNSSSTTFMSISPEDDLNSWKNDIPPSQIFNLLKNGYLGFIRWDTIQNTLYYHSSDCSTENIPSDGLGFIADARAKWSLGEPEIDFDCKVDGPLELAEEFLWRYFTQESLPKDYPPRAWIIRKIAVVVMKATGLTPRDLMDERTHFDSKYSDLTILTSSKVLGVEK
ncbi:hypothetical protein NEOLI_000739 [Neolecta irregularis DAH-3]|uniref:Uncharacterized protein n=1 Tax=Neolecta irregularis (strain DAH-3) TaxID=1198029 RepID=A0A1U7LWF1_NEOID|nr:hypothetical protein NEOLI_000739 [Neolecta irregularis DAH-3]|eukprot:OLL26948.1 hypothetical protein NEOLI_000739 [Neolecta irregularis DAH-3]